MIREQEKGSSPFLTNTGYSHIQVNMSLALRIDEYAGACYHVMNRAMTGKTAFLSEADCKGCLALLEDAWRRWDLRIFSYCLMDTHDHLVLQTPHGNRQRVTRHIDGVYTQRFSRAHRRDGPLFRGRYKGIVTDADEYLAAVVRYIHLNPVEPNRVHDPEDYPWSSYHHFYPTKRHAPVLGSEEFAE
jgi:putative transposase